MKKILYKISVWALIIAIHINSMEQGQEESKEYPATTGGLVFDQPAKKENIQPTISCKQNTGVSYNALKLEKNLRLPSKQESVIITAVDLIYQNHKKNNLYFLGKDLHGQKSTFFQENLTIDKIIDLQKHAVQFLAYQQPFFFYRPNSEKANTICFNEIFGSGSPYFITHNKPIISFGNIQNTVFTGSTWPSIKKTVIPYKKSSSPLKPEPFIENAFLLGCKDNCMVIAKVDAKNNSAFWFWRRFSKEKQDVHVTLYALFFDTQNLKNVTKKEVALLLEEAEKQASEKGGQVTVMQDHVTVINIASNVLLSAQEQENPAKYFPKVAIANDTAIIIHKQFEQEGKIQTFDNVNPKFSIVYKNKQDVYTTNATHLKNIIKKQKQILNNYIRVPYFDEIKNVYLTTINNQDVCVLVCQTDGQGFYADGVYFLPLQKLKNQSNNENQQPFTFKPQPLWHVDIQYEQKNFDQSTKKYLDESWQATEKIVASTFDFANNKLFLITQAKNDTTKSMPLQRLITINVQEYIQSFLDTKEKVKPKQGF